MRQSQTKSEGIHNELFLMSQLTRIRHSMSNKEFFLSLFETSYVALVLAIQGCATAAKMNGAWSSRNSYMEQSQRNEWKSNEIPILMVLHSKAWRAANLTSKSVFAKIDSTKVNCSLFGSSTALLLNSPSLHSLGWNVQTFLSRGPKLCKKVCRFPCLDLGPSFDNFVK